MTRHPSASVKLEDLAPKYGATFFRDALTRFVVKQNSPELTAAQQERASASVYLNFNKVGAYHKVKFTLDDPHEFALPSSETKDVIHVRPVRKNKHGDELPGRFDTALTRVSPNEAWGMQGFTVAQVRLVFKLPDKALQDLFPRLPVAKRPNHLAYIEWFTPFEDAHRDHGLYKVRRSLQARTNARLASIVPIEQLERSCHLYPDFGPVAPREWTKDNVLDRAKAFYVNAFSDRHMYKLVY
ncbi:hypothetical protein C8T65DRAFT_751357 [Cerioporus squamosus]|nr:hypothetical protein C8T65DRAFT_751357 [Cerioporus squamosus]